VTELAVFGTIAGATLAWAAAECLRSRVMWTMGALLATTHSAAAFGVFHGWSHRAAVVATAQQTAALTGVSWGGGIFFNYAFIAIWLADAIWWWLSPGTYRARSRTIDIVVRGFLFFMFFNGAIVFADGWMRVLGIAAVGVVGLTWLIRFSRSPVPAR
jgi:hypothetical protein